MNRLLVECTYVFSQPWVHTGIQRVVRNVAAQQTETGSFCRPLLVAFGPKELVRVKELIPSSEIAKGALAKMFAWLQRLQAALLRKSAISQCDAFSFARRSLLMVLFHVVSTALAMLGRFGLDPCRQRAEPLETHSNDTLLLLDTSWHDPRVFEQLATLKHRGVRILAVVYDLIPIRNSEYCVSALTTVFNDWFSRMTQLADGFVCISKCVCREVQDEMRNRIGEEKMREKAFGWFHLGSELDQKTGRHVVSERLLKFIDGKETKFLVVGSIEPRKNHKIILDAFEQHWASGGQSKLCIVGRVGWMCDDIVSRLKSHPETGSRLFWFNNAGDDELEIAYQNSDALVFASFVEGFGLPLVEGFQRGLPAIASDIPVFREVAGDFAEYFDPNSASDLCAIIDQFNITKKLPNARSVREWKWITWKESAHQLFDAVDRCCRELDERHSLSNAHQH